MAVTGPSHRESSVTQPLLYINPFMIQIPVNRHNVVEIIFNLLQNMLNSKNKNIVKKINKVWKNYSHSSRLFPYSGSLLQISQGLISVQKPASNIQLFLILPKPEREIWDCTSCKEHFLTLCRKRWTKRCHSWHKRWGEWWQVFQALNCKMPLRGDLNGLATVCSSSHPHVGEQHLRI